MQVAPSGEKRGAQTDPGMGEISVVYVYPGDMPPGDRRRSYALEWIKNVAEVDLDPVVPPTYIVRYADLLKRGWGWDRLVAYSSIQVEWCDYKKYLGDYFIHNAGQVAILCANQKPETLGEGVAAEYNDLHAAANLCIKLERKLLRRCRDYLTPEDIHLSKDIKNHAKHLIGSEGDSSVAAAGMVCIAKEADLIFELSTSCSDWDTTEMIAFGNQIRRSASNLMLYKGSKSAAAVAGAMLGLAIEAKLFHRYLISEDPRVSGYDVSCLIRRCTAALLTKLEEELAQETADDEEKSKLEKRKKSEKKKNKRLQKKMKLSGGNETKLHTGATTAVTEELEAEGQRGGEEFLEDLRVFVGNLPFSVDSAQLAGLFEQAGSIEMAKVIYDKLTGRSRGFGFVTMSSVKEVEAAIEQFNGYVREFTSVLPGHCTFFVTVTYVAVMDHSPNVCLQIVTFAIASRNFVMFMVSYLILCFLNQVLH